MLTLMPHKTFTVTVSNGNVKVAITRFCENGSTFWTRYWDFARSGMACQAVVLKVFTASEDLVAVRAGPHRGKMSRFMGLQMG